MAELLAASESPAQNAAAVTPNDDDPLTRTTRALWVGTQGDLAVTMAGGGDVTFPDAVGWMVICVTHVLETGTDASGIVAVW